MSSRPIRIHWLDPAQPNESFPSSNEALEAPNGLLAAGGDLSIPRLLNAYRQGIFPWYSPGEPILWWSPNPRTVIIPGHAHVSRRLQRTIRQQRWALTFDSDFEAVIKGCAAPRDDEFGTWLSPEMILAYCAMHRAGHAHSIELWQDGNLVGGLYGICIGKIFFGESMFSRVTNASKIILVQLSEQLKRWNFDLLDCQVASDHLMRMGAQQLPREQFLDLVNRQDEQGAASQQTPQWKFDKDLNGDQSQTLTRPRSND